MCKEMKIIEANECEDHIYILVKIPYKANKTATDGWLPKIVAIIRNFEQK